MQWRRTWWSEQKRRQHERDVDDLHEDVEPADSRETTLDRLEHEDDNEKARDLLSASVLDERDRLVLKWFFFLRRSDKEIAAEIERRFGEVLAVTYVPVIRIRAYEKLAPLADELYPGLVRKSRKSRRREDARRA